MMTPEAETVSEWAWTSDVVLIIAAAVMTFGVIAYAAWLFMKAAKQEREAERTRGRGGA